MTSMPPTSPSGGAVSDYRLSMPFVVRMLGALVAGIGLLVVLTAVLVGVMAWPRAVVSLVVVVAVAAVVGVVVGGLLLRRASVVHLDEQGYRVRFVRGVGVGRGRWKDVEDVVATHVHGARCVVLRRRDGTTTTIPVGIIEAGDTQFVQDLQRHLNRGHGYRPIQPPA